MNSIPKKFSSNTVLRECSEIYEKNIRIISRELQKTIAELHRSKIFDLKKVPSFIDDFYSRDIDRILHEDLINRSLRINIAHFLVVSIQYHLSSSLT